MYNAPAEQAQKKRPHPYFPLSPSTTDCPVTGFRLLQEFRSLTSIFVASCVEMGEHIALGSRQVVRAKVFGTSCGLFGRREKPSEHFWGMFGGFPFFRHCERSGFTHMILRS